MVSFYCPLKQEPQVPSDANCNFSSIFGVFLTPWNSESFHVDLLRILCQSLVFHLCSFVTHCFLKTATVNATLNIFKLPPPRFFKGKAICKMCLLNLWLQLSVTASLLNHPQAVLCLPFLFRSAPASVLPSSHLHSASVVKGRARCGLTYPHSNSSSLSSKHHSTFVVEAAPQAAQSLRGLSVAVLSQVTHLSF